MRYSDAIAARHPGWSTAGMAVLTAFFCLGILGGAAALIVRERADALDLAQGQLESLSSALARFTDGIIGRVDDALLEIRAEWPGKGPYQALAHGAADLDSPAVLAVVTADGRVIAATAPALAPGTVMEGTAHLRRAAAALSDGPLLVPGGTGTVVARPLPGEADASNGFVIAVLSDELLRGFSQSLQSAFDSHIGLEDAEGTVLVSAGDPPHPESHPLTAQQRLTMGEGRVTVSAPRQAVLAPWRRRAAYIGLVSVSLAASGAFLAWLLPAWARSRADAHHRAREAKEAWESGQRRADAIVDTVADPVIIVDAEGRIRKANRAAHAVFDLPEDPMAHPRAVSDILPTLGNDPVEDGRRLEARSGSGDDFPCQLSVGTWEEGGATFRTVVVRDLSELVRAEHLMRRNQKMEAIGRLSGGIAHDFNNLLGIAIGNLELGARYCESEEVQRRISTAMRAATRGSTLTKRLLAFSRDNPMDAVPSNVNAVIGGMEEMLAKSLAGRCELRLELAPEVWTVTLDRGEFEDALVNLALNAADAMTAEGLVSIETANLPIEEDYARRNGIAAGDYVLVSVGDNGRGIPAALRDRIFEPFVSSKGDGGTGLGLSMVYGFVRRAGGLIKVYSEQGIGTVFRIFLPRCSEETHRRSASATPTPAEALPGGSERVLVVDDESELLDLAATHLAELGYTVHIAGSAADAFAALCDEAADADLLFADIVLSNGANGYDLACAAREIKPGLRVLLTSGFSWSVWSHGRTASGQAPFPILSKPWRRADLAQRVRETLDATE